MSPPLNKNLGKYQLPHIWDGVLQDMSDLCYSEFSTYTPTGPMGHPYSQHRGMQYFLGMYGPPMGASDSPPYPDLHFDAIFFLPYFGVKLVSITSSLRPEEALLLVLTSWKLLSYIYDILFFAEVNTFISFDNVWKNWAIFCYK